MTEKVGHEIDLYTTCSDVCQVDGMTVISLHELRITVYSRRHTADIFSLYTVLTTFFKA